MAFSGVFRRVLLVFPWLLLIAAVAIRLVVWFQDRSLALDEANLALNVCEKGYVDFFASLGHEQFAPPLFMVFSKAITELFGLYDHILRIFPLIGSLMGLWYFHRVLDLLFKGHWLRIPGMWILGFSLIMLQYATEFKQYGVDFGLAMFLIFLALNQSRKPVPLWVWALLGGLLIWLSMPVVFVLAGVGMYLFFRQSDIKERTRLVWSFSAWLVSFAGYYWWVLRPDISNKALASYHEPWFFPLDIYKYDSLLKALKLLEAFPYNTAGFTAVALVSGILGILTGTYYLVKSRREWSLLLLMPFLLCILASSLHLYSMIPRMLVWLYPIVLLIQLLGWKWMWDRPGKYVKVFVVIVVIPCLGTQLGYKNFREKLAFDSGNEMLEIISEEYKSGDVVWVDDWATPAVRFYTQCSEEQNRFRDIDQIQFAPWNQVPVLPDSTIGNKVWLLFGHLSNPEMREQKKESLKPYLDNVQLLEMWERPGALLYLVESEKN